VRTPIRGIVPPEQRQPIDRFAGEIARWMYFLGGLTLLVAVFLLPSAADLDAVKRVRDQAIATESHHAERVAKYQRFLGAIEGGDPATIELLAQSQLGVVPSDREALILPGQPSDPMVFELLEPDPVAISGNPHTPSRLEMLTIERVPRAIMILVGAIATLMGILPPAVEKPRARRRSGLHIVSDS